VAGSERLRAFDRVGIDADVADLGAGEGVAGAAARSHHVVVWPTPTSAAGLAATPSDLEPTNGATTALAMPVRSGSKPFGVLAYYGRRQLRPYDPDDVAMLSALVRQAEIAIDSSFLYDEATRLSLTDGLTGLWNRRHLALRIEAELSRAVRFGEPFSVLYCDLD